jgi:NADPH-dependent curcumin reductase CurA
MNVNRQCRLAAVPKGIPKESDLRIAETPVLFPGAGEIQVRTAFWSVDPHMVVESCRRLGVPAKDYLLAVLPGMALRNLSQVAYLTPARWAASRD